jgi:hypothetical protein
MPSTDRKLELKAKTTVAQTGSQPCVYAKGLTIRTGGFKVKSVSVLAHVTVNVTVIAELHCAVWSRLSEACATGSEQGKNACQDGGTGSD